MAALTDKQREFLDQPYVGEVTTLRDDGSPHTTVVWVDTDTDVVTFNTAVGRAKERYIRRDPRVADRGGSRKRLQVGLGQRRG